MKNNKKNQKEKKEFPLWIFGLILPPVGIILYIMFHKEEKKSNKILKSTIAGLLIYCFIFLAILNKESDPSVEDWKNDISQGKTVVTVLGLTTCSHCQEYKPIIKSLSKKYKFNLYFFEVDNYSIEENETLLHTLELTDYDEHVPFTFIAKNNEYVSGIVGYSNKDGIIEYLKNNGIIEEN